MKINMGTVDRVVRAIFAVSVLLLIIFNILSGPLAVILAVLAVILGATSLMGFCPLYLPFKINTLGKE